MIIRDWEYTIIYHQVWNYCFNDAENPIVKTTTKKREKTIFFVVVILGFTQSYNKEREREKRHLKVNGE